MSEQDLVQRELSQLREQNQQLTERLADAQQAFSALARGQVDSVAQGASATPILLEAAQEQLRNNRKLLRATFDGALDALLLDDDLGAHVDVNAAACELFGLTRAELLGRRLVDSVTRVTSDTERLAGPGGRRLDGHYVLQRPDGARRILDYRAVADVAPGLHLVALRDTTEQAAAQDALRRSEARFRAMIEKSHDGISLLSADVRTLYQSPAVERLLGYGVDDARQASLQDLLDEDQRPSLQRAVVDLLDTPSSTVVSEFTVLHRDGSRRWLQLSATNLLHDPDVGALVANFRDITERKRFEAELRDTEQRYCKLIEELPEPVLVHVDSAIAFANAASARALGLDSSEQLIGRSLVEFATADTRARIVQHTLRAGHDIPVPTYVWQHVERAGRKQWDRSNKS
ncbi:MAG: hypothetical protein RLZZ450_6477 [Pseudomonadota bacterium]|jgi:PAS domain S-box-containing protein